jgi:hypothetical protein
MLGELVAYSVAMVEFTTPVANINPYFLVVQFLLA